MRHVVIVLLLATLVTGCFPHNARHRKLAKWTEGGAIAGGVLLLSAAGTGADCTAGPSGRDAYDSCRTRATVVGDLGLGLILAGLVGFGITQMTSGDGSEAPAPTPLASEDASPDPEAPKPQLPGRAAVAPAK